MRKTWTILALHILCLLVVAPLVLAQTAQVVVDKNPQSPAKPLVSGTSPEVTKYVGAETCKTCHEEIYNAWEKTPHWKTTQDKEGGPSKQGCEGCHGPGADHVAGGGDKTKIFVFEKTSTKDVNARCLTCHASGTQHMSAINSIHSQNNVSCISCHSPHHSQTKQFLLVKEQPELCYTCHLQQKSQFQMPFHHRVDEGLVQCSDCHNVHGTTGPKQVRASATQDAVCYTCHTDYAMFGTIQAKWEGLHHVYVYWFGTPMNPIRLYHPYNNRECLHCHAGARSFESATHMAMMDDLKSNTLSCTTSGCHDTIHNVEKLGEAKFWKPLE